MALRTVLVRQRVVVREVPANDLALAVARQASRDVRQRVVDAGGNERHRNAAGVCAGRHARVGGARCRLDRGEEGKQRHRPGVREPPHSLWFGPDAETASATLASRRVPSGPTALSMKSAMTTMSSSENTGSFASLTG